VLVHTFLGATLLLLFWGRVDSRQVDSRVGIRVAFRTLWGGLVTAEIVVLRIETLTLQSSSGVCSAVLKLSDELQRSVVELLNLPAPSELPGESGAKKKKKKQGS
jgi:hypothetical protein